MNKNPRPTTTPAEPRAFATAADLERVMGPKVLVSVDRMVRRG